MKYTIWAKTYNTRNRPLLVSIDGDVIALEHTYHNSKRHYKEKVMVDSSNPKAGSNGYVGLSHTEYIHRLVAKLFLPNPLNLPMVHHKDHNKTNNTIENLEWVSYQKNMQEWDAQGYNTAGRENLQALADKRFYSKVDKLKALLGDNYISSFSIYGRGYTEFICAYCGNKVENRNDRIVNKFCGNCRRKKVVKDIVRSSLKDEAVNRRS